MPKTIFELTVHDYADFGSPSAAACVSSSPEKRLGSWHRFDEQRALASQAPPSPRLASEAGRPGNAADWPCIRPAACNAEPSGVLRCPAVPGGARRPDEGVEGVAPARCSQPATHPGGLAVHGGGPPPARQTPDPLPWAAGRSRRPGQPALVPPWFHPAPTKTPLRDTHVTASPRRPASRSHRCAALPWRGLGEASRRRRV